MYVNPEDVDAERAPTHLPGDELLTSPQACALLGIKAATLYTYVSRGILIPVRQTGSQASLYRRDELDGLRLRRTARAGHGAVAAQAMHFGQPVLSSAITEITPAGPRYRGHLASDLVREGFSFESTCELLWRGSAPDAEKTWLAAPMDVDVQRALDGMSVAAERIPRVLRMFSVAATALDVRAGHPPTQANDSIELAKQILFTFTGCCGVLGPPRRFVPPEGEISIASHLLEVLGGARSAVAVRALNAALILGADHELSSPTFAARIAASVGSNLHACIVAALAIQRGAALAGGGNVMEDFIRSLGSRKQVAAEIVKARRRRERLPGFVQPLYPHGDPRASALIELAREKQPPNAQTALAFEFIERVQGELDLHPNIEIGFIVLSLAWGLPVRTGTALWGIGRTAGWVAHIIEQRRDGVALRPRGHFRTTAEAPV